MLAKDSPVLAKARLAAESQLSWFNKMMARKKLNKHYLHTKKSWTLSFRDIIKGNRTSDIRFEGDCRPFHAGDLIQLNEWDPLNGIYTGKKALATITYVQRNRSNSGAISSEALANDYVVLSIKVVQHNAHS